MLIMTARIKANIISCGQISCISTTRSGVFSPTHVAQYFNQDAPSLIRKAKKVQGHSLAYQKHVTDNDDKNIAIMRLK